MHFTSYPYFETRINNTNYITSEPLKDASIEDQDSVETSSTSTVETVIHVDVNNLNDNAAEVINDNLNNHVAEPTTVSTQYFI